MMPLEHELGESDVSETETLAYQPDIYQRYSFLRGLTRGFLRGQDHASVLDVGCGPVRLTEAFLGSGFDVVRADIERFDTPDIHVVVPGQPLPFESAAFDLVLALEVLEHVPASGRASFVRELERVSRHATIVCCPVATPEILLAERRFSECAVAISGRDVDFLAEHRDCGLPEASEVASWFAAPGDLLVAENAPLDEWFAFNLLDLIYAADFGDTADKQRFDAFINRRTPLYRAGAAHYRRFFCAISDPVAADVARRFIQESTSTPARPPELISEVMSAVVDLRDAIRSRFGGDLADKDAAITQLTSHVDGLNKGVGALHASLAEHDAALALKDTAIAQLTAERDRLEALVASLQASKEVERAERHVQLSEKDGAIDSLQAGLHEKEAELDALRDRLRSVLSSRSWRATEPARMFVRGLRRAAHRLGLG